MHSRSSTKVSVKAVELPFLLNSVYEQLAWDDVVFEGELLKYRPGFVNTYVSRYCKLNKHAFRYYKNFHAGSHRFPLVEIDLDAIDKVERVSIDFPAQKELNQFQFEIFLKKQDCQSSLFVPHNYIEESKVGIEQLNLNEARLREDPEFKL
jgi:hypothetical protein